MSPIGYSGRNRTAKNARWLYGIAIDLDGVEYQNLRDLFFQAKAELDHRQEAAARVDGGMGACPHLRGRGRSSHEEAAAVRDGRGSPSHQHTVTGRQLYFLLLSAGGRESVTSKPFSRRGGGCRPPPPILSWKNEEKNRNF